MTDDKRDHSGIVAPPPLIYLGPLVLGCCSTEGSWFPLATRFEARAPPAAVGPPPPPPPPPPAAGCCS
jgi:hypothetical protein